MDSNDDRRLIVELQKRTDYGLSLLATKYHAFLMDSAMEAFDVPRYNAGEVVNKVFLDFWRVIDRFVCEKDGDIKAWLITCLKNRCID